MPNGILYRKLERLLHDDPFIKDINEDKLAERICNKFKLTKRDAKDVFREVNVKRVNRYRVRLR